MEVQQAALIIMEEVVVVVLHFLMPMATMGPLIIQATAVRAEQVPEVAATVVIMVKLVLMEVHPEAGAEEKGMWVIIRGPEQTEELLSLILVRLIVLLAHQLLLPSVREAYLPLH